MTSAANYRIEASNSIGNTTATISLTVNGAVGSRFLYTSGCTWNGPMANPYFTGGIYAFKVELATGVLSPVPGSPFAPTATCGLVSITQGTGAPIAISHDSKFLYSVDSAGNLLALLIHSDGSLSAVPGAPFTSPESPIFLVADPTLDFLYVSGNSGKVMVFAIDSTTGAVNLTSTADTNVVDYPGGATVTPDGRYYYQAFPESGHIVGFSTSAVTGALSPVPGSPLVLGSNQLPEEVAVDPAGKFLYVSNGSSQAGPGGSLYAYSIDALSGALTAVPGSPFGVSEGAQKSIAVDATGKFLIAPIVPTTVQGNGLIVLSISPDTGELTSVAGSPFGLPYGLVVAADPSAPYVYMGVGPGVVAYSIDQVVGGLTQTGEVVVPGVVLFLALTH